MNAVRELFMEDLPDSFSRGILQASTTGAKILRWTALIVLWLLAVGCWTLGRHYRVHWWVRFVGGLDYYEWIYFRYCFRYRYLYISNK